MTLPENDVLNSLVSRVLRIDDVTAGDHGDTFLMRYRGQLLLDSIPAYDQLAAALRPYGLTPLFRKEGERHIILLTKSLPAPRASNVLVNVVLFILTLLTVVWTGMQYTDTGLIPENASPAQAIWLSILYGGLPFAVSMLGILLAHEFGHYLTARRHNTDTTLPYFIPFPTMLGTMGAVIVWKEPPKNKRILFDVGVAGPLAGLVVAIPVLLYGLSISHLGPIESPPPGMMGFLEGNSLLYLLAKFVVFGKLLPAPAAYDVAPLLYWLRFFFTGQPVPLGGLDVQISAVALAGWAGILVTALNLIPAGQLDGGHVMYVLFGKRLRYALPILILFMAILGIFWSGWWLWIALLLFFGRQSAEPLDQITELDPTRRALAWFMILVFILVFMPVPMILIG